MHSTATHARVWHLLYPHGYGNPLCPPQRAALTPSTPRATHINIGDVGVLSDDSGFEYLWNVHSASDLPAECEPLPARKAADDNVYGNYFLENTAITSANVESKAITSEGEAGIEFSIIDSDPAAVLVLPRGGSRVDVADHTTYQQYAVRHAAVWHAHLRDDPRHKGKHGSLYLVTGTDKCHDSCGVASFANSVVSGTTVKFVASGASTIPNKWVMDGGVEHSMTAYASGKSLCVFVRGFVIATRDPMELVDGSKRDTEHRLVSNTPAAVIAAELLQKSPQASYAVVHDDYWIVPTKRGDLVKRKDDDGSFLERMKVYASSLGNITVQDGVCTLAGRASQHPLWHGVEVPATLQTQEALLFVRKHSPPKVASTGLPGIVKGSEVIEPSSKAKPRLSAIVIGINAYNDPNITSLRGAVADADAVVDFLHALGVDDGLIRNLRNQQATRAAIIDAITSLESDPRIERGDPILIYYAGHGAQAGPSALAVAPAPHGWEAGGPDAHIQMLVPHDFSLTSSTLLHQQGILDLEIARYLEELARAKGDNITVILDCCHSGSGTRDPFNLNIRIRGIELPPKYTILREAHVDLAGGSRSAAATPASHVLLSACSTQEYAQEMGDTSRGLFTYALLQLLQNIDIGIATYRDIISQLSDLPRQHPQCEGGNSSRVLFDAKSSSPVLLYPVTVVSRPVDKAEIIVLEAGAAQGIAEGAEFDIFRTRNHHAQPVCRLRTTEIFAYSSVLRSPPDSLSTTLHTGWARQITVGKRSNLVVSVHPAQRFLDVITIAFISGSSVPIRFVDLDAHHELAVRAEGDNAVFIITDPICVAAGLTRLPHTVSMNDAAGIYYVLSAAAHFFFHLRRSNTVAPLASKFVVDAFELRKRFNPHIGAFQMTPYGPNLAVGSVVQIEISEVRKRYGFKLTSGLDDDVFVSAFMFDMSDLTLISLYQPGHARAMTDPSILRRGSLTFGYGAGGIPSVVFEVPNGSRVDVTYLKIFITSVPVDFSDLARESPFNPIRKVGMKATVRKDPTWDSLVIAIVQKVA